MKHGILGVWPVIVLIAAACGGSTSSGSSVSPQTACTEYATAVCGAINGCSSFLLQAGYGDTTTCQARLQAPCLSNLGAKGTGMTPGSLSSCAKALAGAACGDLLSNNLPTACRAAAGQLANGAACADDSQCQTQYCNKGTNGTCGACGTRSAGGACNQDDDCGYGSVCNATANGTSNCVAPGASGAPCDDLHPCNQTLACKNATCAAPDEAGNACTAGSCDSLKGLFCNPLAGGGTCQAVSIASPGQPCGLTASGFASCTAHGNCNNGTCSAAVADGATCSAMINCMLPAECSSNVCKLADPSACQ